MLMHTGAMVPHKQGAEVMELTREEHKVVHAWLTGRRDEFVAMAADRPLPGQYDGIQAGYEAHVKAYDLVVQDFERQERSA